jgi:sugar transferase (PEP-CTERM system associated)
MSNVRSRFLKHLLYFLFDILSLGIALFAAIGIYNVFSASQTNLVDNTLALSLVAIGIPLGHLAIGLYETKIRESIRGVVRRIVVSMALVLVVASIIHAVFSEQPLPITLMSLVLGITAVLHSLWRNWGIFHGGLQFSKRKILIVGAGERAAFVTRRMRRKSDRNHFNLLGFIPMSNHVLDEMKERENIIDFFDDEDVDTQLQKINPDVIVMANDKGEPVPMPSLLNCKMRGVDVIEMEDFIEFELGQIAVERMKPEWLLFSSGFKFKKFGFEALSNMINIALAFVLVALSWPLMLGAVIAIYLDDGRKTRASVFYKQIRVGLNGRHYEILKFRSMGKDAEKDGAQWAQKDDMRVTRVGGFLRKYRIDELPQLLNVLRGDMNFVGPRPERPEFVDELSASIPFYDYRHSVKPGLTGWALLKYPYGASVQDSLEKLKFDLYYIKHRSILLDFFILIRTVEIVLFGRGR